MKAVVIGSDLNITNFATLAVRLRWPDAAPIVASSGAGGVALVKQLLPDLVLVHHDLADMELSEVIQEVRHLSMASLTVLGCHDNQTEVITALTLGADDYVKLPCNITELTVRIWATYRRTSMSITSHNEAPLRSGPLLLNFTSREAFLGEQILHLTPTEFRLLRKLIENNGSVVTHKSLEITMCASESDSQTLVKKYVQRLRSKLGDNAKAPHWIACVHGIGYRFIGPAPTNADMSVSIPTQPVREPLVGVVA